MKIAVTTKMTTFHKGFGGLETQNKLLCEGLAKKGHDLVVFSQKKELTTEEILENGVKYVFIDSIYRMGPVLGFGGGLQKLNWVNRSVEEFEKHHKDSKFDLVISQSSSGLGIINNKKRLGIKVVSIVHGSILGEYKTFIANMTLPQDFINFIKISGFTLKNFYGRQRAFIYGSDKVIAVSNFVKNALLRETFAPKGKFVVINNGVDFPLANALTPRGTKLLYVGQILKSKGLEEIIKLFSDERFSKYSIDIIGSGSYLEELKVIISSDSQLRERINIVGRIPYEEVIAKYFKNPEYGVFLFPTKRHEGFPMVIAEAMLSGLPVVAYNMGGVNDAVEDQTNGFLVASNDLRTFKERVLALLQTQSTRDIFAKNSLTKASTLFTVSHMLEEYEKIINEVVYENS